LEVAVRVLPRQSLAAGGGETAGVAAAGGALTDPVVVSPTGRGTSFGAVGGGATVAVRVLPRQSLAVGGGDTAGVAAACGALTDPVVVTAVVVTMVLV
jgi:hypothetical protein